MTTTTPTESEPRFGWTENGKRLDDYQQATLYYAGLPDCPECGTEGCSGYYGECPNDRTEFFDEE